jgi:hypothetical protein
MSMLLVVALLAQAPERVLLPSQNKQVTQRDDDWAAEREQALAEAMEPAFVITPPTGWAGGATKRFVGAFVGGLVGMAVPAGWESPPRRPARVVRLWADLRLGDARHRARSMQ